MIFAAIVAGGTGSRMGADRPKQFLTLGDRPVLIHTIERFLDCPETDKVYIGVHKDWVEELHSMCDDAGLDSSHISILAGGMNRDDTIRRIIKKITNEYEISDSDIILTHDGVRPFVSQKEIRDSINAMESCDGATVCLPSTDTLLYSEKGEHIDSIADRSKLFRALTPQTFRLKTLVSAYKALTPFRDWKYSFAGKAEFQFDFGFLIPGEWTHIVTKASYTARYEACTAAKDKEPWAAIGSETANGFTYSATFVLGYMLPFKLNLIGLAANFKGHYSGSDFGEYASNYDGGFTEISFALQSVVELTEKDQLQIGATIPSRRAFSSEVEDGKACVSKTTYGREWYFNGVSVVWKHSF